MVFQQKPIGECVQQIKSFEAELQAFPFVFPFMLTKRQLM